MRDFLLNEALKRLAADAAVRLSALIAEGDQIPFDVAEQEGPDSAFCMYEPLTSRFVLEREDELRGVPSFVPARDAVDAAGVAAAFLESVGEPVPADPRQRASRMLIVFLAALWDGSTEFSLDRERLEAALVALDAEATDAGDADVLIVPVVGLRMSRASLQLPHGVRLIRADAIEAPIEAMRSDGMGRSAWEPQYLAVAEQDESPDSAESAMRQLHELISVMRLFKPGGIGLGPYAFAPTAEGHWGRIPTGAEATRPGGYRLNDEECDRLADFATTLEALPDPDGALSWAVGRFEMGCARASALDGLSDHLLSLRAVLDGHGPVGASLPMRASALIADASCDRIESREKVESALELERSLMNGAALEGGAKLAAWVEEGARRLLRQAALGELGDDLTATADESLIATGLAEGDIDITVSVVEPEPEVPESATDRPEITFEVPEFEPRAHKNTNPSEAVADPASGPEYEEDAMDHHDELDHHHDQDTRIMEPVPAEDEIRITATNWLDEVDVEAADETRTLDFPSIEGDIAGREKIDTPRVRHLFPVPEDADWEVRELKYDHYNQHAG